MNNAEQLFEERIYDPKWYLENLVKIKGKTPGLIPFIFTEAQKDFANTFRKHNRMICLKARQMGFSTLVSGLLYHNTITIPGTTTALIGYNSELTSELLDKIKTFIRSTPESLRPEIQYNSKFEISFPNIESKILCLPSTTNVGRGYTLTNALVTELPFWEKAEEKMIALMQAIPPEGKLIIESTPAGVGDYFHRLWVGDNIFVKKQYGWWWHYSHEEMEMRKSEMNNDRLFSQEYELEFLTSGRNVFDVASIRKQFDNILKPGDSYGSHIVYELEGLRVFKEPEESEFYICGVDSAEGIDEGDYAVATFLNRRTGEEVAKFRGKLPPDRLADKLYLWGSKYNNALMVIEVNNHGLVTQTVLKSKNYPSFYFRPGKIESFGGTVTDRLGWKTTQVTRPLLVDDLSQALREESVKIHSHETLNELLTFVYNDRNQMQPQAGLHDDCIFSVGLALQGFKVTASSMDEVGQLDEARHTPVL